MQAELANKAGSTTYMAAPSSARTRPAHVASRNTPFLGVKTSELSSSTRCQHIRLLLILVSEESLLNTTLFNIIEILIDYWTTALR